MTAIVAPAIRPLETGERISRDEFHRRYAAEPREVWAELIEGVVYVAMPLRAQYHGDPEAQLGGWMIAYQAKHSGVKVAHNATVKLDAENEVQPDLSMRVETGGQTEVVGGYIEGAPELVPEIAASSGSIDLHEKMEAYRRNGIREYLVWRVLDGELDWFVLRDGAYVRLEPDADGVIESETFPGLRLPVRALLEGDLQTVLDAVR